MESKTIKWGIIGCGNVTELKSGPAFNKTAHSQLVAVMRRDAAKAKDYAKRHGVNRWYSDADELIADAEVSAIYVATPPNTHAEYTIKALRAGKPVYCEKPMALNAEECQSMLSASLESNQPLFVAYYRRGQAYFHKIKELLDSGAIGKILTVNLRLLQAPKPEDYSADTLTWRVMPEISGGGYFMDLAPHQLDILQFLLGGIADISGFAYNQMQRYDAEDVVTVAWQFETGIMGVGQWCFSVADSATEDVIEFVGTKGRIQCATFAYTPIVLINDEGTREFSIAPPAHAQQPYIEMVVLDLLGHKQSHLDVHSALHTSRLIDRIMADYYL